MQFKLPELGEGVHEGELVKWKVKVGDMVGYDQSLCEIMTDKATVEIPSAFKGKVGSIDAKEGETRRLLPALRLLVETARRLKLPPQCLQRRQLRLRRLRHRVLRLRRRHLHHHRLLMLLVLLLPKIFLSNPVRSRLHRRVDSLANPAWISDAFLEPALTAV
jgi:hypothetical protein